MRRVISYFSTIIKEAELQYVTIEELGARMPLLQIALRAFAQNYHVGIKIENGEFGMLN